MLALLGALKEEIKGLRRSMVLEETITQRGYHMYRGKYGNKAILLVQTGCGRERVERVTEFILEHYPITALISFGFGGALTEGLRVGDIILCSTLYCGNGQTNGEAELGNPYHSDASLVSLSLPALEREVVRLRPGTSVTVPQLVSRPEAKRALGQAFHADVVDMESYWIARITLARKVPFLAIRALSDAVQDGIPPFDQILDSDGRWRWQRAALYFLPRPQHLLKLFTLYQSTRQARKSLTALVDYLVVRL